MTCLGRIQLTTFDASLVVMPFAFTQLAMTSSCCFKSFSRPGPPPDLDRGHKPVGQALGEAQLRPLRKAIFMFAFLALLRLCTRKE